MPPTAGGAAEAPGEWECGGPVLRKCLFATVDFLQNAAPTAMRHVNRKLVPSAGLSKSDSDMPHCRSMVFEQSLYRLC